MHAHDDGDVRGDVEADRKGGGDDCVEGAGFIDADDQCDDGDGCENVKWRVGDEGNEGYAHAGDDDP